MHIEWRRDADPSQPNQAGRPELVAALQAEIESTGPLTFARFMDRALYEPGLGYYAASTERPTRSGDFLTAPELHPIFGQTLAVTVDEVWRRMGRPAGFVLREFGAGSGALFLAVLDGLLRLDSPLAGVIRYQPIDLAVQQALVEQRLAAAGRSDTLEPAGNEDLFEGVALANEFLDALPVHRVVQRADELRERYVDWRDERFVEIDGELSDQRLSDWFNAPDGALADGQRAEANLAMLDWLVTLGATLERGAVLVIDYGAGAAELYRPERHDGTIRAFSNQLVSSDVLGGVGTRDITAHVDFDALERGARGAGLEVLGRRRAAEFLLASGLDEAYRASRAAADQNWQDAATLRSAVRRLLDPSALGGYQVALLGRAVSGDPPLRGMADLRS